MPHRPPHAPDLDVRRHRRGNYSMILGVMMPIFLGFAALSVDTGWIRMAESQAQDVADASAHAALIELRRSGDQAQAKAAVDTIVSKNKVANGHATVDDVIFGSWERGGAFSETTYRPNAVTTEVSRTEGTDGVELLFARIWGRDEASVEASAVAASRSLHAIIVMDITGSFSAEISEAAKAAVAFLDIVNDSHGKYDKIGMSTFYYIYGHERSPLTYLDDEVAITAMRADWLSIRHASRISGSYPDAEYPGPRPHMPREYDREQGTDHHVGVVMARDMFDRETDPFAYRAMVVLTDGQPINLRESTVRDDIGYVDDRWNVYEGPVPHTIDEIKVAAVAQATEAWDDQRVHTWVVSFREANDFMRNMVHGDGVFYHTTNANELKPIFEEIAHSLPLLIVE